MSKFERQRIAAAEVSRYDSVNTASSPVFNIVDAPNDAVGELSGIWLATQSDGISPAKYYRLTESQFEMLTDLCQHPLSPRVLSAFRGRSEATHKNSLRQLYQKFEIYSGGKETKLLAKLWQTGILSYAPRIDEDEAAQRFLDAADASTLLRQTQSLEIPV
jgi:hypothetical protein